MYIQKKSDTDPSPCVSIVVAWKQEAQRHREKIIYEEKIGNEIIDTVGFNQPNRQ